MKRPLVLVEWEDSAFTAGWRHGKVSTSLCKTAGYLVEKDKALVVIAMNVSDTGSYGEAMAIPRACVRSIRRLRK